MDETRLISTMEQTPKDSQERRTAQRFPMRIPIRVKFAHAEVAALTRDVSTRGLFFYMEPEQADDLDPEIVFLITFPPEITFSTSLHVRCRGRVVRRERSALGLGVAAEIHHYQFVHGAVGPV